MRRRTAKGAVNTLTRNKNQSVFLQLQRLSWLKKNGLRDHEDFWILALRYQGDHILKYIVTHEHRRFQLLLAKRVPCTRGRKS